MRPDLNPFRTSQLDALHFVDPEFSMDALLEKLERFAWRGQVLGAHGSGKTTLMRELAAALRARGEQVVWFNLEDPALDAAEEFGRTEGSTLVLMNGSLGGGRLQGWLLRRRMHRFRGFVVSRHQDHGLPLLHHCKPSLEILDILLDRLCGAEAARYRAAARQYFQEEGGNLHEVLLRLYDDAARLPDGEKPTW